MIQQQAQGLANALTGAAFLYTQTPEVKKRRELRPQLKETLPKIKDEIMYHGAYADFSLPTDENATVEEINESLEKLEKRTNEVNADVRKATDLAKDYINTSTSKRGKEKRRKELAKLLDPEKLESVGHETNAALLSAKQRGRKMIDVIEEKNRFEQTAERQKTFKEMLHESNPAKREELMNTWGQNFPTNKQ